MLRFLCVWILTFFVLACFVCPEVAQAVTPAPDGDYGNGNTAEGGDALFKLTDGSFNTAVGLQALYFLTTGSYNTAVGAGALYQGSGNSNTAVGNTALAGGPYSGVSGSYNTAVGDSALANNGPASNNTAVGYQALTLNIQGSSNTAIGSNALRNGTGTDNTAIGISALEQNTGNYNTATGGSALNENTSGYDNTATGLNAMFFNKTGHDNTADGLNALLNNTSGSNNVAVGKYAGYNLTTGSNNIDIGAGALGTAGESGKIRIGKPGTQTATFVAGIYNIAEPVASGIKPVYINSNGQLGTTPPASSARYKEQVKSMDNASEAILALNPVTFRYKNDEQGTPQFGLIAEEVAKVNPDLVVRDDEGKIYTVRYDAVNAMLLNEFLKEHEKVAKLETALSEERKRSETRALQQQKQIEALSAAVQKVSDKVELKDAAADRRTADR